MNQGHREILFGDAYNDYFEVPVYKMYGMLKADVYEEDSNYILEMDIAGFNKEDVMIDYNNGYLTVHAKKENLVDDKNFIRRELFYGEMKRSYYVGEIDESLIKANFENGMLRLVFPKKEKEEEPKKIINIQ